MVYNILYLMIFIQSHQVNIFGMKQKKSLQKRI